MKFLNNALAFNDVRMTDELERRLMRETLQAGLGADLLRGLRSIWTKLAISSSTHNAREGLPGKPAAPSTIAG